jgi:RNA polymerase sigma-70 factor, ECF subfamily
VPAPTDSLLDAARSGDEAAFEQLVEPHRRELHAHCYRMLGSLHDTEEAMQEAMLRVWRGLDRFEGRSPLRWMEQQKTHLPFSLDVLTLEGDRIKEVTAFVVRPADTPDGYSRWPDRAADPRRVETVFRRFGLPDHVD